MAKKLDVTPISEAQLNSGNFNYLKANSPHALPNSPTAQGWSADAIKRQLYKATDILFVWIQKLAVATNDEIVEISSIIDSVFDGTEVVGKATNDSEGNKISSTYATLVALQGEIARSKAADATHTDDIKKISDEEAKHVHIKLDNSKVPYAEYPASSGISSTDNLMTREDGQNIASSVNRVVAALGIYYSISDSNKRRISDILDGTSKVANAKNADVATYDSSGNKINAANYGKKVTLTYVQSTGVITVHLFNQNNDEISTADYNLPTELIFDSQGYDSATKKLWFHPTGNAAGANVEIDVTDLFDVYTGDTTDACISVSVLNNKITATIKDGSIGLDKMSSTFQSTWDSWTSAEATRASNESTRQSQEATRQQNELTRQASEAERLANYNLYRNSFGKVCLNYSALKTH
ncbi:MAG: hypothetical protein LKG11_00670 [Bacilli bacterium]|jgi:hypothetical protein|nr:hypothetical protein [Bacilli bacterium]